MAATSRSSLGHRAWGWILYRVPGVAPLRVALAFVFNCLGARQQDTGHIEADRQALSHRCWRYLQITGVWTEFRAGLISLSSPLNLILLAGLQQQLRPFCATPTPNPYANDPAYERNKNVLLPTLQEATRLMKIASTVYGQDMVHAIRASGQKRVGKRGSTTVLEDTHGSLCKHAGVCSSDSLPINHTEFGESTSLTNHFVAVDHVHNQVILAVRGTFSLTDVLIDLEGYAVEFCGGLAHAGMSRLARHIWNVSAEHVRRLLLGSPGDDRAPFYPDYELLVTGQSLGAGIASLLTLWILHEEHERSIPSQRVRCLAYAPPPIFCPGKSTRNEVLYRLTAFRYNNDCVVSLSLYNLRLLSAQLAAIDQVRRKMGSARCFFSHILTWLVKEEKSAMSSGTTGLLLLKAVREATTKPLPSIRGSPPLQAAPGTMIWMRRRKRGRSRNREMVASIIVPSCHCNKSGNDPIKIARSMLGDHPPIQYEQAFSELEGAGGFECDV